MASSREDIETVVEKTVFMAFALKVFLLDFLQLTYHIARAKKVLRCDRSMGV